jgi:hypothetical protein
MTGGTKRWMIACVTLCVLAIALVACDSSPVPGSSNGNGAVPGFKTPNPGLFTPTPTFPPFTVGAWPSNYSPQKNDTVTIYVLCRVQVASMNGPSTPPSSALSVHINAPDLSKQADGSTDAEGLAAIPITYVGAATGKPVRVYISVTYKGKVYTAETLFTPDVSHQPTPTANPSPSASPSP